MSSFSSRAAQRADALGDEAPVGLQLRLAGAAQSDAALLPLEVGPAAHQARRQMRQLRELHLQLALEAAGALRKNIQNQSVTIQNSTVCELLEIALLARSERLVDQHDIRIMLLGAGADFLGLARADEILRVGPRAGGQHQSDAQGARPKRPAP